MGSITTWAGPPARHEHLAALLGDGGEPDPEGLELGEHRVLRRAVDHERQVAALAPPRRARALGRLRVEGECAAHPRGRPAAEIQPVGGGGRAAGGGGHRGVC